MRKRKCGSQKYLIWWGKETVCGSMHTSYLNGRHLRICWVYTTFLIELSIMLFTEVEQIISWRKNKKRIWNYVADIEQSVHEECCINKNVIPQIFTWIYILYQVTMPQLLEKNQWKRLMKISNVGEAAFHLGKF